MSAPSPWLAGQLRHERAARHTRRVAAVSRVVKLVVLGAGAGAAAVLALQFMGVIA